MGELHVVTGAFGFSGRHIAERLLARGVEVRTLTGHPGRANPFGGAVSAAPFRFDDPAAMAESMRGARVLYNTYWIRFERGAMTFERAVANTQALIEAARNAGVRRIVHVSITNPSADSPLPYFSGKARLERDVMESGMEYAILRPAVIFGEQGVLINNIAWLLRRFPLFGVPGSGEYGLQPIFVDDLAELAVEAGAGRGNSVVDAIGPETFTFNELARAIRSAVRSRSLHRAHAADGGAAAVAGHRAGGEGRGADGGRGARAGGGTPGDGERAGGADAADASGWRRSARSWAGGGCRSWRCTTGERQSGPSPRGSSLSSRGRCRHAKQQATRCEAARR